MKFKKYFIYLSAVALSSCNTFSQVNTSTINHKETLNFKEIINCDSLVVLKDSFNYYFNKADDLINTSGGITLSCGLRMSDEKFSRVYFFLESDTNLLLLKKVNLKDSSITISFLNNQPIETVSGEMRGCWNEIFMKLQCDKFGMINKFIIINNDAALKPKEITFK